MSEFKEGDKVLVRATVAPVNGTPGGPDQVPVNVNGFTGHTYFVPSYDVFPVPVEPQPVDPSTLRVGDRVRREWETVGAAHSLAGVVTDISDAAVYVGVCWYSKDLGTWFLLDRPEAVDPRREAVKKAVEKLRLTPYTMTDDESTSFILAAIDGAVQR